VSVSRVAPLVLVLVVAIAPAAGVRAAPAPLSPTERGVTDGGRLYQRDCAYCHGDAGQGTQNGQSLQGIGAGEVDYAVSTGRMPKRTADEARRRRTPLYTRGQIDALVAYLTPVVAGGPPRPGVNPAAGDLQLGGELFRAQCASCHQWAGEGGGLLGRNAPSLHQATAQQIGEAIRSGPVTMPAFSQATLSDHDVDSIARYVLYLRHPKDRGGLGLWHLGPFAEGLIAWVVGMTVLIVGISWIGKRETRA
jgi:ubiquinol-cytochrome c reductase cytochrome c subunit